jgi:hypothetical protein
MTDFYKWHRLWQDHLTEGTAIYQNNGNHVFTEVVPAKDFATIKKLLKAAEVLNLEVDIVSDQYGDWEDKNGDAVFQHDMLFNLKGKKFMADPSADGKLEQLFPSYPTTDIRLKFYRKR